MAAPYQQQVVPFSNGGMLTKVSSSSLQPGQYQRLVNTVALQEGAIQSRNGFRRINATPLINDAAQPVVVIHSIGRLAIGAFEPNNFRYIGWGQEIYRVPAIDNPTIGHTVAPLLGVATFDHKWMQLSYRKLSSGLPYAYFATESLMLKDPLTDNPTGALLATIYKWGIDRPVTPARVALGAALPQTTSAGNCNVSNFTVLRTGGAQFDRNWSNGTPITINGLNLTIFSVEDSDHLTLTTTAATTTAGTVNSGNLTGVAYSVTYATVPGPNSTITDYAYVYTFRNQQTGAESNPSMVMLTTDPTLNTTPIRAIHQAITVTVNPRVCAAQLPGNVALNTNIDPQVTGNNSIAIYRRGGSFGDGFYRFVGYVSTTGAQANLTYTDTASDASIAANRIVEFDNDPPVTSTLPIPFRATISSLTFLGGAGEWTITLNVTSGFPPGVTNISQVLRPGGLIKVGVGATQDFCVIWAINDPLTIQVFLQFPHIVGEPVEIDSIANQPCNLTCLAFDSIFLAGDFNNPNVLYKSKTGSPESFPVVNLEDGSPGSIEVGTPSNPIMAICEFNGQVICLNKSNIFIVEVWNGAMQTPILTPAQRGLFGHWAWCKADNEIWYLSYDGVYSWSGGQSMKRSEAIDPIFKGEYVNGFQPISMSTTPDALGITDLDRIQFAYEKNYVLIIYNDINGNHARLRYSTIYDRWSQDVFGAGVIPFTMFLEEDKGNLLLSTTEGLTAPTQFAFLNQDDTPVTSTATGSTDGWVDANQDDGLPVAIEVQLPYYTFGLPSAQKQFGDIVLELVSETATVTVQTYYDFSPTPDATDTFTVPIAAGRRRYVMPLKSGSAQEAYSISFKLTATSVTPIVLHSLTFNYFVLENIQRGRALDWDDLGHPWDKRLQVLTVEYDTQNNPVVLNMDTMTGIAGATETQAVQTFTLNSPATTIPIGPVRSKSNYPINDGIIAKLIRLRPTVSGIPFKMWMNYTFKFFPYPADKVLFTDWEDAGYAGDKIYREVTLDVDTASCNATVNVQIDGMTRASFQVRTSSIDRKRILTMPSNVIGKMHRLLISPDPAGKFQLFAYKFNWIGEPYAVLSLDSYEQQFNINAFKFLKQVWCEYRCESSITLKVYRDQNQLLLSTTLPQHLYRNSERFYLPPISSLGILNKSKTYRFIVTPCNACAPIYWYVDGSRVEFGVVGGDQREGYQQFPIFEKIPVPAPAPASE